MNLHNFTQFVTLETIVVAAVFVAGTILAWRSGAGRIAAFILAGVLSTPMAGFAAHAWVLRDIVPSLSPLVVFVVLFALIAFLFDRLVRADLSGGLPIPTAAIGGLAAVTGLSAIWTHTEVLNTLHELPVIMQPFFAEPYAFWWIAGSLIALLILSR